MVAETRDAPFFKITLNFQDDSIIYVGGAARTIAFEKNARTIDQIPDKAKPSPPIQIGRAHV